MVPDLVGFARVDDGVFEAGVAEANEEGDCESWGLAFSCCQGGGRIVLEVCEQKRVRGSRELKGIFGWDKE